MEVFIRFLIVWGAINAVLLPIEFMRWKRAKAAHWSWKGFVEHYMWDFTYFVLICDGILLGLAIIAPIVYWILSPVLV